MRFLGFAVFGSLLVVACGGKLDSDADASVDSGVPPKGDGSVVVDTGIDVSFPPPGPDSGPKPPPPPPTCSGKQGSGFQSSDGSCGSEEKWTCSNGSAYSVICACPADGTCSCFKDTVLAKKVPSGSVCPGCGNVGSLAGLCGFPE
jgi:hypothetical protein